MRRLVKYFRSMGHGMVLESYRGFFYLRVFFKLLLRRFMPIASFCKRCGRSVHDFSVPDNIWEQVDKEIRFGHILCYGCFCEICGKLGLPSVWRLERLD